MQESLSWTLASYMGFDPIICGASEVYIRQKIQFNPLFLCAWANIKIISILNISVWIDIISDLINGDLPVLKYNYSSYPSPD